MNSESSDFYDMDIIKDFSRWCQLLLGVSVFVQTFRGLVILRLLPSIGPSMQAIAQTLTDARVLQFLAFLVYMVAGLGIGMSVIYGSDVRGFSTWYRSVMAAYRYVWGDWDIDALFEVEGLDIMSNLFFFFMSFVITGTLSNVFIAIVGSQYDDHLKSSDQQWIDEVGSIMSTWFGRAFSQHHGGMRNDVYQDIQEHIDRSFCASPLPVEDQNLTGKERSASATRATATPAELQSSGRAPGVSREGTGTGLAGSADQSDPAFQQDMRRMLESLLAASGIDPVTLTV